MNPRTAMAVWGWTFNRMRAKAKRDGKKVPTLLELAKMVTAANICPDCNRKMVMFKSLGHDRLASLQHYRDGTMNIVCMSCNTRHHYTPGDTYREMPKDHKYCPSCKVVKPFADFSRDASRSGPMKLRSRCRKCMTVAARKYRAKAMEVIP